MSLKRIVWEIERHERFEEIKVHSPEGSRPYRPDQLDKMERIRSIVDMIEGADRSRRA